MWEMTTCPVPPGEAIPALVEAQEGDKAHEEGKTILAGLLLIATALFPATGEGGRLGEAIARGAARSVAKALRRAPAPILRRDFLRDRALRARPLPARRRSFATPRRRRRRGTPEGTSAGYPHDGAGALVAL